MSATEYLPPPLAALGPDAGLKRYISFPERRPANDN